jgi:hypothetical protein
MGPLSDCPASATASARSGKRLTSSRWLEDWVSDRTGLMTIERSPNIRRTVEILPMERRRVSLRSRPGRRCFAFMANRPRATEYGAGAIGGMHRVRSLDERSPMFKSGLTRLTTVVNLTASAVSAWAIPDRNGFVEWCRWG